MTDSEPVSQERRFVEAIDERDMENELVITSDVFKTIPDRQSELCSKCASLNLDHILQLDIENQQRKPIQDLGSLQSLQSSRCHLCQLWGRISTKLLVTKRSDGPGTRYYLGAYSFSDVFTGSCTGSGKDTRQRAALLGAVDLPFESKLQLRQQSAIEKTGYVCLINFKHQHRTMCARLINQTQVDFDLIRHWWNYCSVNHETVCRKRMISATGLKVIDCRTRKIVEAPQECRYVALSYVWGNLTPPLSSCDIQTPKTDLPQLPKTIEDSISVLKELDLHYLWVDKYCIDQFDENDKNIQINQMDLIYSEADLTIIAAAGDDPGRGLPGINGTPRTPQGVLRIGDYLLAQSLPHPQWSVSCSKWATRAWTYQEGILSRRRLIFTSEQVLYECEGMHCVESMKLPLDAMHTNGKAKFEDSIPRGAFSNKRPGMEPFETWDLISQYYEKELSYPADRLNAMQGIFRILEKAESRICNISGIPIFQPAHNQPDTPTSMLFLSQLLWRLKLGERIPNFPSWSWAGWRGGRFNVHSTQKQFRAARLNLYTPTLWVESVTGDFQILPDDLASSEDWLSINKQARFLEIEAWTLPCSLVCMHGIYPVQVHARFPLDEKEWDSAPIILTSAEDRSQLELGCFTKPCIALIIPEWKGHSDKFLLYSEVLHVMVVAKKDDFWERVGIIDLHGVYSIRDFDGSVSSVDSRVKAWFHAVPKIKRRIRLG